MLKKPKSHVAWEIFLRAPSKPLQLYKNNVLSKKLFLLKISTKIYQYSTPIFYDYNNYKFKSGWVANKNKSIVIWSL